MALFSRTGTIKYNSKRPLRASMSCCTCHVFQAHNLISFRGNPEAGAWLPSLLSGWSRSYRCEGDSPKLPVFQPTAGV